MFFFFIFRIYLINTFFIILFLYKKVSLKIIGNFEFINLDNGTLINVKDHHNLSLIISTSKRIYTGLIPNLKSTANEDIYEINNAVTFNENYTLISCFRSSLIAKMNINSGIITPIDSSISEDLASKSCPISIINNIVYIYLPENRDNQIYISAYEITLTDINNIKDGPSKKEIINTQHIFNMEPVSYTQQIDCENILDENFNNNYLVCLYVNSTIENNEKIYNIYGIVEKSYYYYIFNTKIETYVKIEKVDSFTLKCIVIDKNINLKITKSYSGIIIYNSSDIFYYNYDLISYYKEYIFSSSGYDLKIEKNNSFHYYYFNFTNPIEIIRIKGIYVEENDNINLFYQTNYSYNYIKLENCSYYFNMKTSYYKYTIKDKSNLEIDLNTLITSEDNYGKFKSNINNLL